MPRQKQPNNELAKQLKQMKYEKACKLSHEDIIRGTIYNGHGAHGTFSIDAGFSSMKGKNLK